MSHPDSATPKQSLPARHTPPTPLATIAQRTPLAATVGNEYGSRWRCQRLWVFSRCCDRGRSMPLGFKSHPEGIFDNSPTFQRWVTKFRAAQVPKGRVNSSCCVNRPFGTNAPTALAPNVETLGYFRMSLRDRTLHTHKRAFARSNPSGIDRGRSHSCVWATRPKYDRQCNRQINAIFLLILIWNILCFSILQR